MKTELSPDDIYSIKYFWERYEDPTRWCGWKASEEAIKRELPAFYLMYEKFAMTKQQSTKS